MLGRTLIWAGLVLLAAGILISVGGSLWNRIPGNFEFKGKNWTIYFPFGICLVVSILGTLLLWLFSKR